jgi:hypothetical protein
MMLYNKYFSTSFGSSEENVLDLPNSFYFPPTNPSTRKIYFIRENVNLLFLRIILALV